MNKRFLLCLLLVINACVAGAQKFFINSIDLKTFLFTDDYGITGDNWPHFFKEGYHPLLFVPDTLLFVNDKRGSLPSFRNGWSVRVDLVKSLFPGAEGMVNRVDLMTGIGYRYYSTKDDLSPYNSFWDTAKLYSPASVKRKFTQHYADIQSRAIYKLGFNDYWIYTGFAVQVSLPFAGAVQEDYIIKEARWNTTARNWMIKDKTTMHQKAPAKKIAYFSWGVPVGFALRLSKHLILMPEISYWHNINRQYYHPPNYGGENKSYSESGYLTIGVRYKR